MRRFLLLCFLLVLLLCTGRVRPQALDCSPVEALEKDEWADEDIHAIEIDPHAVYEATIYVPHYTHDPTGCIDSIREEVLAQVRYGLSLYNISVTFRTERLKADLYADTSSYLIWRNFSHSMYAQGGFEGDGALYISDATRGIASQGQLCNDQYNYATAGVGDYYEPWPIYSRGVHEVTHEVLHLLGARHPHDPWWPDGPLYCCERQRDECQVEPLVPAYEGSVMSYCGRRRGEGTLWIHPAVVKVVKQHIVARGCTPPLGTTTTSTTTMQPAPRLPWPNPATTVIIPAPGPWEIYNVLGKRIGSGSGSIDVSNRPAGIYLIRSSAGVHRVLVAR